MLTHYRRLFTLQRGFSLIELMVGLAITSAILMVAMPNIKVYLLDSRIRTAAQAYYDGIQLARAEALRRNTDVSISLTDDGKGWKVSAGGNDISVKLPESAGRLTVEAEENEVVFNSSGAASAENTVQFLPGEGASCMGDGGQQRCMNVKISVGGQARLCDPSITEAGDERKC